MRFQVLKIPNSADDAMRVHSVFVGTTSMYVDPGGDLEI